MQFVFHIGAHCTDAVRLIRSLRKDLARLAELEVAVPKPRLYRTIFRDIAHQLQGQPADEAAQDLILATTLGAEEPDRAVFNLENYIASGPDAFDTGALYPQAQRCSWLAALFPEAQVDFAVGIRNPATWIPEMYATYGANREFFAYIAQSDPRDLLWSDYVARILDACPGSRVILWCNEDLPLIWPEVLRIVADLEDDEVLAGDSDVLEQIMQPEGLARMQEYTEKHKPIEIEARREVTSAFLDKFVIESEVEQEIDLPGWNQNVIATLTRAYEDDLEKLAAMPNVLFIRP